MSDCIFCKILSGEIPSATVYEDDEFKAILDRFPSNKGHVLILPKTHVANIFEIDPDLAVDHRMLLILQGPYAGKSPGIRK